MFNEISTSNEIKICQSFKLIGYEDCTIIKGNGANKIAEKDFKSRKFVRNSLLVQILLLILLSTKQALAR